METAGIRNRANHRNRPTTIEPGNPNNWPRRIARKHKDLGEAIDALLLLVDDRNMEFALTEFIRERIIKK